jgi:hydroxypyruvate isomerase
MTINRRAFLGSTIAAGAAATVPTVVTAAGAATMTNSAFKLKYAPHFGMFKHHAGEDHLDQLKFAADQGFVAWEDNGMMDRPLDLQEKIARTMNDLGMTMGVFVSYVEWKEPTMVHGGEEVRDMFRQRMKTAVEVAKRVNARWSTLVPGPLDHRMDIGYQTANVVDNLRACAEVCEPAGLVLVLEPLNPRDHPELFLTKISQAFEICRAVNSPSVKILDDLYHQQVTEGNLIPNIDRAWSEIAYFQVGDNPGRKEPTTGEINYANVFKHIHEKGFTGVVGMEHGIAGKGKEGEIALLKAYRAVDEF